LQKLIKERVVLDFFTKPTNKRSKGRSFNFSNESVLKMEEDIWIMYFDGALNHRGFGGGILLISAEGAHTLRSLSN